MKQAFFLVVAMLCQILAFTQQQTIMKTIVIDSITKEKVANAIIVIMKKTNSIIVAFSRTDDKGTCLISGVKPGEYHLKVIYSGYTDYSEDVSIVSDSLLNVKIVNILPISHFLEGVIVHNEVTKIRIKGDTIEYKVDSFYTDRNASVEDLLKRLPGIIVKRNGTINAYGKKVEKILVDGEEFFSDDPTLVTQSLKASIVDKVQIFEKKSDQAEFSKMNDGKLTETINLQLKEDKKNGSFGKISLAKATNGFFDNQLMLNRFKNDEKISIYSIFSNIGKTGLSWQEQRTYSDYSLTSEEVSGFSTSNNSTLDNWDGTYQNQGIPNVSTTGVHYNNKFYSKDLLNINYRYFNLGLNQQNETISKYFIGNEQFTNKQYASKVNTVFSNKGTLKFNHLLNANSEIIIGFDVAKDNKHIFNAFSSYQLDASGNKINAQKRNLTINGDNSHFNSSLLWRKKNHNGSTFSLIVKFNRFQNDFNGFLKSEDSVFNNNIFSNSNITDQYKVEEYLYQALNSKLTFTYPINNSSSISTSASITYSKNENHLSSYNKDSSNIYSILDPLNSNNYKVMGQTILLGFGYNINKKNVRLNLILDGGITYYNRQNESLATTSQNFRLLFPTATFTYSFNKLHKIVIDYTGNTILPIIQQVQPAVSNIDPLNVMIGNPNLKSAFKNALNIQYYNFKINKDISFSAGGFLSFFQNGFSTKDSIDNHGIRIYTTINIQNITATMLYVNYTFKMFHKKIDMAVSGNIDGSNNAKIINGLVVSTNTTGYEVNLTPSIYKQNKYGLEFKSGILINSTSTKTSISINEKYFTYFLQPTISIYLFKNTVFKSDYYFTKYPTTTFYGSAQTVTILNASLIQKFYKSQALSLQISARDIFNSNSGVIRGVSENYSYQSNFNTISQYFMVSLIYNFSHSYKTISK